MHTRPISHCLDISAIRFTHALCGARRVKQVAENVVGGQLSLTTEDIARFRKDIEALGQPS